MTQRCPGYESISMTQRCLVFQLVAATDIIQNAQCCHKSFGRPRDSYIHMFLYIIELSKQFESENLATL